MIWWGFIASFLAGAMTAVGALPALFGKAITRRSNDALLGFAAGVMLAASFFSLILPALDTAVEIHGGKYPAAAIVILGILIGAGSVALLNELVPHEHFLQGRQGPATRRLSKIWLLVLAITIHNVPEGLAVGVGYGSGDVAAGTTLAIGIGLQNAPEGLAVAVALRSTGYSSRRAFAVASLTGAVEPLAGLAGAWAVSTSMLVLPWALSFAAGAMLYVISHKIIPETHTHGQESPATLGLMIGFVIMLFLDVVFGS